MMESRGGVNQGNNAITSAPDGIPDQTHIPNRQPSLASPRSNSSDQQKLYTVDEDVITASSRQNAHGTLENGETLAKDDPYALRGFKRDSKGTKATQQAPQRKDRKIKRYYNRQNALIDAYLGSSNEEALEIEDTLANGGKVKFAVNASFVCNFFLFVIQMYAAVSTGSLALFATAADAFVSICLQEIKCSNTNQTPQIDLVSSLVMLVTSRLAAKPNIRKYPVVRRLYCLCSTRFLIELQSDNFRFPGPKTSRDCWDYPLLCSDDHCLCTADCMHYSDAHWSTADSID